MRKRRINFFTLLGVILVIAGLSSIAFDFFTQYQQQKSIETEKKQWLSEIRNIDISNTQSETVVEDSNIWGLIQIDKIELEAPINTSGNFNLLLRYLVAYKESPLPPNQGNFAIAGHAGVCANCGFDRLKRLSNGDEIQLMDRTSTYIYEVYDMFVIKDTDVWVLDPVGNETTLTLITCDKPHADSPDRLIIRARLTKTKTN